MNVLIAPNAFKGSLSALHAAELIARSLPADWNRTIRPIADGGNGTLDCLVNATGGRIFTAKVTGPYPSRRVHARWGELGNSRTAIIEMAEASGLHLLSTDEYSASNTTTFGVGELIVQALDAGFRTIYVGLGGSATNDGGAGCVQALGARLLDHNGNDLLPGGIHLRDLQTIDVSRLDRRIDGCEFICLADVQNVIAGPSGTSRIYGPQKGANLLEAEALDGALEHYATLLTQQFGVRVAALPGGGAAGGLGAALYAFCRATIVSGIDRILDLIGFDQYLRDCDLVLTGEGSVDEQTAEGKGIAGIARRAAVFNKTVHVFAGRVRGDADTLRRRLHVQSIHMIAPPSMSEAEAMRRADALLELKVKEVSNILI